MNRIGRILSANRELRMAVAVLQSGLFNAESYGRRNPDVPGPALRRAWHYVRFGRHEERRFRRGGLSLWLLPHILDGVVSAGEARRLSDVNGRPDQASIDAFCKRHGLDPKGHGFWAAYTTGDFDAAERIAGELDGAEAFRAVQRLAVRVLRLRHLPAALDWGLARLDTDHSPQRLAALADMAEALGRDTPGLVRKLVDALLANAAGTHNLRSHLWRMRLPLLGTFGDIVPLKAALPAALTEALAGQPPMTPQCAEGWGPVFEAAALNLLQDEPVRLTGDLSSGGALRGWARAGPDAGPAILLRLPHATHWLAADTNEMSASFIEAFKTVTLAALEEGLAVQPVQAGRIHVVDRVAPQDMPILSYHSMTTSGRPGLHFKEAAIPGYFALDPSGFSGWASWHSQASLEAIPQAAAEAFHQTLFDSTAKTRRTKYKQTGKGPLPDGRFVLFALQVPDDSVSQLARIAPEATLDALLEHYAGRGTKVVVKRHPYDVSDETVRMLAARKARHDHLVESDAPIHALLERAALLVTVNSGVGVEALVYLKQVIATGLSDYAPAVHAAGDPEGLRAALSALDEGNGLIDPLTMKRYLYAAYAQNAFRPRDMSEGCRDLIGMHLVAGTARRSNPGRA